MSHIHFSLRRLFSLLALAVVCVSLLACGGGGGDSAPTVTPEPPVVPDPGTNPGSNPSSVMSLIQTQGTQWVNASNQPVDLRGVNVGNWLLQEFWMMGQSTELVNDQCTLESILTNRFGFDEKERLMTLFRDSWITERDWDLLASFGFNVVRVPFIYHLIEDDANPYHLRDDAWVYLDEAIAQAEARGMYIILDLHGVVGSQWDQHTTGCEGQNEYWVNQDYQDRTTWLWEQIATRYKDNNTVAAYGLLNEPWGTDPANLADVMQDLYAAVRAVDPNHTIILPGHNTGIGAYGVPSQQGMTNVAFEMHFYPGFFGWGNIGYDVHRDWLTCGTSGVGGVCEWDVRLDTLNTAFLIGEFQPWAGLDELGGPITRATYDTYASFGWATTSWSYKLVTNSGGQGDGTWGLVTNQSDEFDERLIAASTWDCAGWDTSFANACGANAVTFTAQADETLYLVIKAGSLSNLDVTVDEVSLIQDSNNQEMVLNGGFGSATSWSEFTVNGVQVFDYANTSNSPIGSAGNSLRITGGDANGGIYQPITLQAGESYTLSGVFKDNVSTDAWAEVFLVPDEPQNGVDVTSTQVVPQLNFAEATLEEIEALFMSFATMEYDIHEEVRAALLAPEPSNIFDLPVPPTGVSLEETLLGVELNWSANTESGITGYNVYRSEISGGQYTLIAENIALTTFTDVETLSETRYYVVSAISSAGEGLLSDEVAANVPALAVPGTVQAEWFSAMSGVQTEATTDVGGGVNVGYIESGDWLEYDIDVAAAGTYLIEYRVASLSGSSGFTSYIDGGIIDLQGVPNTGDWQAWVTISATVNLSEGNQTLLLLANGGGWNINWIRFTPQ